MTAVVPFGGLAGWTFLQRTADRQIATLAKEPVARRNEAYFRDNIGRINTAEDLVADRRLLEVALTAFGLESDIENRFFIRKVLEDGTLRTDSLSNRLGNKQYRALSAAFGFGDVSPPRNKVSDFADRTIVQYRARRFETSVGQQDNGLRLALNFDREVSALAGRPISDDAKWFTILGTPPLREVFDKALALPSSFSSLDIDRQLSVYKDRMAQVFGVERPKDLSDPTIRRNITERFLLRADNAVDLSSRAGVALRLLQVRL
jgi:hypothetical protein